MLPGGGSEYAKHIKTPKRGQNYDLMELHSGMRDKVETVSKIILNVLQSETRRFLGFFIVLLQSLLLPI